MVYAPQIAAKMGTQHHLIPFEGGAWVKEYADFHLQLTEGFHSWIHGHGLNTLDYARSLMEVNLTGLHGAEMNWEDPVLYGAPDEVAFTVHLFGALCEETTWPSMTEAEARVAFAPELSPSMQNLAYDSFCSELAKYQHLSFHQRIIQFSLSADRRLYQYYTVFYKAFIEQRFPFYDYDYFEFIHALPPAMRFKRKLRRAMILKMMRPLARIPYDKDDLPITDGLLPLLTAKTVRKTKSLLNRLKVLEFPGYATLYADYENWLRHELRDWGQSILLDQRTLQRNIFNPDYLNSLWRRHQSGLEIHTIGKLAPIMTYEMVLRKFYDQ
jgi:asparagine synthase (glutamine-hydrolysing)